MKTMKKTPSILKNVLYKAVKSVNFINLDPWVPVFLIFHVIEWEECYISPILNYACLKEKYVCDWVAGWTSKLSCFFFFFLNGTIFLLEGTTNCSYLNLGICVYVLKNKWSEPVTLGKTTDRKLIPRYN